MLLRLCVRVLILTWVAIAAVATRDRAALWPDERGLWADAVAQAPAKPRPWINLGRMYALDGAAGMAEDAYLRGMAAAEAGGRSVDEHVFGYGLGAANVALLRCRAGDRDGALTLAREAVKRRPAATALTEVHTWLERGTLPCSSASSF